MFNAMPNCSFDDSSGSGFAPQLSEFRCGLAEGAIYYP
jgi:hypothetical protein